MVNSTVTVDNVSLSNKLPNFKTNEYGFNIHFVAVDDSGAIYDLTGKTVTFQIKSISSSTAKVSSICTIDDAAAGSCHYTVQETDFDEVGLYEAELDIVETGVKKRVVKMGLFAIIEEV